MPFKNAHQARLQELRLDAAAKALVLTEKEIEGFIRKENARLLYQLQECIDLIAAVAPTHPIAKVNVYTLEVKDGVSDFFSTLTRITESIHDVVRDPDFNEETKLHIGRHLVAYAEILSKLGGFLNGLSLSEDFLLPSLD